MKRCRYRRAWVRFARYGFGVVPFVYTLRWRGRAALVVSYVAPGWRIGSPLPRRSVDLTRPFLHAPHARAFWLCCSYHGTPVDRVCYCRGRDFVLDFPPACSTGRHGDHLDAVVLCYHARQLEPGDRQRFCRLHGDLPVATGVPGGPAGHGRRRRHGAATASPSGAFLTRRAGSRALAFGRSVPGTHWGRLRTHTPIHPLFCARLFGVLRESFFL